MAVGITWSVQELSCGLDSRRMVGLTECPAVSFHESLRANTNSKDRQNTKNKLRRGSKSFNQSLSISRGTTPLMKL
jgi:hypothetical protein